MVQSISLKPQANLNWQDDYGCTAFHQACTFNHSRIVRFLLDFHDDQGRSIQYNLADRFGSTPFSQACYEGLERLVKMLLEDERIDVNQANNHEETPLWTASFCGQVGVVKLLLASGRQFDVLKADLRGRTPAEIAELQGFEEIASLVRAFERTPDRIRTRLRRELGGNSHGKR